MKAHERLVRAAMVLGYAVDVWDGEEWQVLCSRDSKEILAAIDSVEQSELVFRHPKGGRVGWALVIPGLAPTETVADHSVTDWIDEVFESNTQD